jgi:hypothetical protein
VFVEHRKLRKTCLVQALREMAIDGVAHASTAICSVVGLPVSHLVLLPHITIGCFRLLKTPR